MKRNIFVISVIAALMLSLGTASAQSKRYTVLFYNVENLYDTIQDPTIYDTEFIPTGIKEWNSAKYNKKLANLEKLFYSVAQQNKAYPTIIGVSEVENRNVLEDIASQEKLIPANYQICHYDGPDARGVDVAFFYRPDQFKYEGSKSIKAQIPGARENFRTRDLLAMWGEIDGEDFFFIVSHWPSRRGGQSSSADLREGLAAQIKGICDEARRQNPNIKVAVMGDFNDDATDASITKVMGAKAKVKELESGDFFNPFNEMLRAGLGTLAYQDVWNLFDNICVTENLVNAEEGKLRIIKGKKFYGNIFTRPYMLQQEGQYKGYPLRTFVTNNFQNGFSDHFPVYIYIGK